MMQGILFALRGFRRSPGVVFTVVVTIGLALGLNTTMFTIFNAYVLRPFDVRDPYSIYSLEWITKNGRRNPDYAEFEQFRVKSSVIDAAFFAEHLPVTVDGQPFLAQRVSGNYFETLGIGAAMGRVIREHDAQQMVLSYGAWRGKLNSDPQILGRGFAVAGTMYIVVGIANPGFEGVAPTAIDFWMPLSSEHPAELNGARLRIKHSVSIREAQAELGALGASISADRPPEQRVIGARLILSATPLSLFKGGNYVLFAPIFIAFGLVLLIACANIANVLLARAAARQKEIAIRLSLGAGRARIIHQLLIESMLLAVPAAIAAFGIAQVTTRMALQLYFATVPKLVGGLVRILPLDPDVRVFGFLLATAFGTTLAFGLAPALEAARASLNFRRPRLRSALVVSQVAICALLLIVSGILVKGSRKLESYNPGFKTEKIFGLQLQNASAARAVEKVILEPWAESAAVVSASPMNSQQTVAIGPANGSVVRVACDFVSPEYFHVLSVPILRGRNFSRDEANTEAPVAIISAATARQFWPGSDALGQVIRIEPQPGGDLDFPTFRRAQIIGIAADIATGNVFSGKESAMFYFPTNSRSARARALLIRIKEDTRETRRALSETMERQAPGSSKLVYSFDEMFAVELFPFKLSLVVASFLGGLALVLAISGVYGVLSYLVAQRVREIGIRMALGASTVDVVRLVLGQSARFATWGMAIGGLMALAVSRIFAALLEQINTYEPVAYAVAFCVVFAAAMAAAYVPSIRAARVDPASTLRHE